MRAAERATWSGAGRVVVVDARAVVRHGLVTALRALGHRAIGVASAQEIDGGDTAPAAVIVDGSRTNVDIHELHRSLAAAFPATRLLVVADGDESPPADGIEMVRRGRGAAGLASTLNDQPEHQATAERVGQRGDLLLSDTERAVLRLIARGATAKEAAAALAISPRTVENHKRRIFDRLGASTQAQAVSLAIRKGELSPLEHAS